MLGGEMLLPEKDCGVAVRAAVGAHEGIPWR